MRDRDPFERALETLRARLAQAGPLQGASLPIATLAAELGVSTTPVREALSRLAGEGLVARTDHGYAAPEHDPRSLAELYGLAGVLVAASLTRDADLTTPSGGLLSAAATSCANRALAQACARLGAQLAPLAGAEQQVFDTAAEAERLVRARTRRARSWKAEIDRYYRRRAQESGRILAVAIGLIKYRRI